MHGDRTSGHHRGAVGEGVLTPAFRRVGTTLHCEGVPLGVIADGAGTPTYVYSAATLRTQYARLDAALSGVPHRIHYAMKANGSLGVLRTLRAAGAHVDCVSSGELYRAQQAGFTPEEIIVGGVGKRADEIEAALDAGVACITAESEAELELIAALARRRGMVAPVAIRVNPEVTVHAFHDYVKTGQSGDKFGIPLHRAFEAACYAASLDGLRLVALQQHIGSLLTELGPYGVAADKLVTLLARLRAEAPNAAAHVTTLDLGGGFGVRYDDEPPVDLGGLTSVARRVHAATGCTIAIEPGRFLVAESGVLLSRVLYRKDSGGRTFVIADAGMNDLVRPALYGAHHRIEPVDSVAGEGRVDLVGPVCESGDFLARDRVLSDVPPGALLVVHTAGAYGFVMSSNYNARPRAAEVLVDGARWGVIRTRERHEDLVRGERVDPNWSLHA